MRTTAFFGAALLLASCASVSKVETAKSTEIHGLGVLQNPTIADLNVREQKVSGSATGRRSTTESLRALAVANAARAANADLLVAPVFVVETTGSRATGTVTGFPANYTNFRHATAADSSLVRADYAARVNTVAVEEGPPRKKSGGWVAAIATVVVGVVVAIIAL